MSKNLLLYGNCQVGSLNEIFKKSFLNYKTEIVLCWLDNINKNDFLDKITKADIIITQPIHKGYKNVDYLHTEYILENAKKTAKIFIFPSLFFNFYYFDLTYKTLPNGELLREPSDYHYLNLINYFKENKSIEHYLKEIVNNDNLKNITELENMAIDSINELIKRENEMDSYNEIINCKLIQCSNFIEQNYKNKLLFYSMNHPSKYIFHYIAEIILEDLKIEKNINYDIDPLFNHERGILYKVIQKVVNFNIVTHLPRLHNYNLYNIEEIVNKYYEIYKIKLL
jgi:hypothetical protein